MPVRDPSFQNAHSAGSVPSAPAASSGGGGGGGGNGLDLGAVADYLAWKKQQDSLASQSDFSQLANAFGGALGDLGGLLSSLLGGGGKGGKGKAAKDIGDELGLKRDEIQAQRDYLTQNAVFGQRDIDLQKQMLGLQGQQAGENRREQSYQFQGNEASRGALTTAGSAHQNQFMHQQFMDLMKRIGINQQQVGLGQQENDAKFAYGFKKNNFAQENLDLQAGQAGFQSPFSVPNPVPVQQKKK